MQTVRTAAASAVLGIILLPFPSHTLAQQTPAQPSVQQPSGQQSDLNDTQLRSFAKIYVQVEKILKTYDSQLKEAKTPEESKQIQNEEMSTRCLHKKEWISKATVALFRLQMLMTVSAKNSSVL